jgi:hypothetical protein
MERAPGQDQVVPRHPHDPLPSASALPDRGHSRLPMACLESIRRAAGQRDCAANGGPGPGKELDALDLRLLGLIDARYTRRPFYGSRRLVATGAAP